MLSLDTGYLGFGGSSGRTTATAHLHSSQLVLASANRTRATHAHRDFTLGILGARKPSFMESNPTKPKSLVQRIPTRRWAEGCIGLVGAPQVVGSVLHVHIHAYIT